MPDARFSIVDKDENGQVAAYNKIVLDNADLGTLNIATTNNFNATGEIKFSNINFDAEDFRSVTGTLESEGGNINLSRFSHFPGQDTSQIVIMQKGVVDSYNNDAEILSLTSGQALHYTSASVEEGLAESDGLFVKPIGPRIRVTNEVYSINGIPVEDTIVYEADKDIYIHTLLTVKNTGTDISSNTIIRINPGPYYTILEDSLDANCSVQDGNLVINMGDVLPGEIKKQYLPFVINATNVPEGVDIRTIIDLTGINYEGTLVDTDFSFEDPEDVLLDLYDFEAVSITFTDLGNGQVEVTAEAHNRGIFGENIWFRIYPIVGDGVYEFPFAEISKENFEPGETLSLKGVYTLPNTDKSIEFMAIVDDGYKYIELSEVNNRITIDYQLTNNDELDKAEQKARVYPMPYADVVNFEYVLQEEYQDVNLLVYSSTGQLVAIIDNCPGQTGTNRISWRNSNMPAGNYSYYIKAKDMNGGNVLLFNGPLLKTQD